VSSLTYYKSPKIPSCLLAIFEVKTRDFEEKSLKTGNFTCSLYLAEYYLGKENKMFLFFFH
jgi:hypothetical protein